MLEGIINTQPTSDWRTRPLYRRSQPSQYQPTGPALRLILGWPLASIHGLIHYPQLVLYIYQYENVYLNIYMSGLWYCGVMGLCQYEKHLFTYLKSRGLGTAVSWGVCYMQRLSLLSRLSRGSGYQVVQGQWLSSCPGAVVIKLSRGSGCQVVLGQ